MQPSIAQNLSTIKWGDLHTVLVVSRASSIKKASVQLKTTESTVSRRVRAVEAILGFDVFERTPMGMVPTAAGQQLLTHLGRAEAEVEQGLETSKNQENKPEGVVRITSVPILMNRVIIPASGQFLTQYPGIELEVIGASADLSMSRREADVAIRLARPSSDQSAVTRRIGTLKYGVFVSKSVASEKRQALPWLNYDRDMSKLPQARWITSRVAKSADIESSLKSNDAEHLLMAAKSGYGKAVLPNIVVGSDSQLIQLCEYDDVPSRELWLMVHPNVVATKKIRLTIEWLSSCFDTDT